MASKAVSLKLFSVSDGSDEQVADERISSTASISRKRMFASRPIRGTPSRPCFCRDRRRSTTIWRDLLLHPVEYRDSIADPLYRPEVGSMDDEAFVVRAIARLK